MSQYPPYETCNLGFTHVIPSCRHFPLGELQFCPPGWISVEDRLPNEYHFVLISGNGVALGKPAISLARYEGPISGWNIIGNGEAIACGDLYWAIDSNEVTHWMPLPEAPK